LIDEVLAGQIDIVTCPHCLQDSTLMNLNVRGSHCSQQSLKHTLKLSPSRTSTSLMPSFDQALPEELD
jgi:hypothetical protein